MATTGARSSAIMAAGTLVSRILGFVKTLLITVAIGLSVVTDVFELSNQLPNLIYVLVAGGVFNAVLVPQIIKASTREDGGADYISRLLSLAVIGLLLITVTVILLAYPIISLMGRSWSEAQVDLGVTFALWCFPQIFFYGLYTVVGQILNAKEAFGWYMWTPVLNNLIAIASLLVFITLFGRQSVAHHSLETWTSAQTFWLAGTATVGVACQALVLFLPLWRLHLGLKLKLGWRGIGLGRAAHLSGWILTTGIIANLSFLFLTWVASIATGFREQHPEIAATVPGIASLNYSVLLYQLPHGVIGLSIATVLFNRMARSAEAEDRESLIISLSQGLRITSVATIFCAVALIVFAGPLGVMFSGGNPVTGITVGQVLTILALGGPFLTMSFMMGRMFYAHEDARTPFINQTLSAGIMVALGLAVAQLSPRYIVFAVAGLYVLQNILATFLYHRALRRWLGDYDVARIVKTHLRVTLAALLASVGGVAVLIMMGGSDPQGFMWTSALHSFITALAGGSLMGLCYLAALKLFQVRELDGVLGMIRARLGRSRR